jgi:hypothetical protein
MFLTVVAVVSVYAVGLSDLKGIYSLSHVFTTSNITALYYWS